MKITKHIGVSGYWIHDIRQVLVEKEIEKREDFMYGQTVMIIKVHTMIYKRDF